MAREPLNREHGLVTVNAWVESRRGTRVKLAVDSGANYTTIPVEAALAIGIAPGRLRRQARVVTGSGVVRAPVARLRGISVLGHTLRNLDVVLHDLPEESFVDGVLGLNFLEQFDVLLLFRQDAIDLQP